MNYVKCIRDTIVFDASLAKVSCSFDSTCCLVSSRHQSLLGAKLKIAELDVADTLAQQIDNQMMMSIAVALTTGCAGEPLFVLLSVNARN